MQNYWTGFESWITKNAPSLLDLLNPGATQVDIDKLEAMVGRKLPEDFIAFYKVYNGQDETKGREGLIYSEELLSIDDSIGQWQIWQELLDDKVFEDKSGPYTSVPDIGVKNNWWNPYWVPFTYDGFGNHVCIDLDPQPEGHYGQVIRMWHDDATRELYATSFKEYIENYTIALETGEVVYAKTWGLVAKDSFYNKPS